jgi:hypothetical protein
VDHITRRESAPCCELGVARRAPAELATFCEDRRASGTVNRAVDATSAQQAVVCGIDDGIGVLGRYVTFD